MDTTLILTGVACVVAAIIGGGVKLLQVEVRVFDSLQRQFMLGLFGAGLIVAGLLAGGHLRMPAAPRPDPVAPTPTPEPAAIASSRPAPSPSPEAARTVAAVEARPEPQADSSPEESLCDTLASRGSAQWRRNYLRPAEAGTFHIFVETLGSDDGEQAAQAAVARWSRRFGDLAFDPLATESVAGANPRWAVVAASGLRRQTAETVARFLRTCGVAPGAYSYQQDVGPAGF